MRPGDELIRLCAVSVSVSSDGEPSDGDGYSPARQILRAVSIAARVGRCLGVVGPSGSGKSSALRAMAGGLRPDEGTVGWNVSGRWIEPARCSAIDRRHGQRLVRTVHQEVDALNELRTAVDIVADPLRIHAPLGGWWARATGRREEAARSRAAAVLAEVGLAGLGDALVGRLSGGQKQRVAIARAIALEDLPAALLLDEPTSSLDPLSQAEVLNVVDSLRRIPELAIVLVSHDLHVIRYLCDEVVVLHEGTVADRGPTEHVFDPARPNTPVPTRELLDAAG